MRWFNKKKKEDELKRQEEEKYGKERKIKCQKCNNETSAFLTHCEWCSALIR